MGINSEDKSTNLKLELEVFQEIFEKYEEGIIIDSLEEAQGSDRGDNYTALLFRYHLKGFINNVEGKKLKWDKSVICKKLPKNKLRRDAYKSERLFRNEIIFYNFVIPELIRFQASKNNNFQFNALPKCYLARDDLVVLEDLRVRNFIMPDRQQGLSLQQIQCVIKELARFHSLSLSYKDQFPDEFNKIKERINEGIFSATNTEWYRNYYKKLIKNASDMILQNVSDNSIYYKKFNEFVNINSFFMNVVNLIKVETPLSVICHGDCWTNNFLYRYEEGDVHENGGERSVLEVCLVDFQLIRYGSLTLDISNLIYCCTDKELRHKHMKSFLQLYHQELVTSLRSLGSLPKFCNNEKELWNLLQSEFKTFGKFGLGLAIDILPISTCDSDEAPDLYIEMSDEANEAPPLNVAPNELCGQKMTDILIDLVDANML